MAEKNELYEVIDNNIIPNGVKAITGQGLKNTLYAMADEIGNGSGNSIGQIVFYLGKVNLETNETTLTPEQKAHNAEMAKIIKESPISLNASIDAADTMFQDLEDEPNGPTGVDISKMKLAVRGVETIYTTADGSSAMNLDGEGVCIISELFVVFVTMDGSTRILEF